MIQSVRKCLALDPLVHDDVRPDPFRRRGVEEEFRGPEPLAVDRFEMALRTGITFQQAVTAFEPDAEDH